MIHKKIPALWFGGSFWILFALFLIGNVEIYAQGTDTLISTQDIGQVSDSVLDTPVVLETGNQNLLVSLKSIARQAGLSLSYSKELIPGDKEVVIEQQNMTAGQALWHVLRNTSFRFGISASGQLVLVRREESETTKESVNGTITGTVVDAETGEPMPGASVFIEGTTIGDATDVKGKFLLNDVEVGNYTLVARFVGFKIEEKKITVNAHKVTTVKFRLELKASELGELVVIGYGEANKNFLTGSSSSVEIDDLTRQLPASPGFAFALQGAAAGVQVVKNTGQPGGRVSIRIRGGSSLTGSNEPLYIVDGFPVNTETNKVRAKRGYFMEGNYIMGTNPLLSIDIDDIKSIEILKDAAATAIYGSRASNGVVLITTKRGSFNQPVKIEVNYGISYQNAFEPDLLNTEQFKMIYREAAKNAEVETQQIKDILNPNSGFFGNVNTNWIEAVQREKALISDMNISLSGGTSRIRYFVSLSNFQQKGTLIETGFEKYAGRLNLNVRATDKIRFGARLNYSVRNQNLSPNITDYAYSARPDYPVYNDDGGYKKLQGFVSENPVAASSGEEKAHINDWITNLFMEYNILDNLTFRSQLGYSITDYKQSSYIPSYLASSFGDGQATLGSRERKSINWENTLTYVKDIASHNITAIIGTTIKQDHTESLFAVGRGFPDDNILNTLGNAQDPYAVNSSNYTSGFRSFFGRVLYNYGERYLFSLTGRFDGSSKFSTRYQYGFFPAIGIGWRISNESFMQGVDWINELKLRASYGVTGSANIGAYRWRTLYNDGQYAELPAVVPYQFGNNTIKWETAGQFDVGIDFELFNNRLRGSIDYYRKISSGLLTNIRVPNSTGYSQLIVNRGKMKNTGVELELETDVIRSQTFNWIFNFNIGRNRNVVLESNGENYIRIENASGSSYSSFVKEGAPYGSFYGYVVTGIFQDQETIDELNAMSPTGVYQEGGTALGDFRYKDISGSNGVPDGVINFYDQAIIGNIQPDFYGGFTNIFQIHNWVVTALFIYTVGNDLYWVTQSNNINMTYGILNKSTAILDRWTLKNRNSSQPRVVIGDPNDNARISSYYVHDASYLRLRSLTIGYNFSPRVLQKFHINRLRLSVTGTNLFTLTSYPGPNPAISAPRNSSGLYGGYDRSTYPASQVFTFNINIEF